MLMSSLRPRSPIPAALVTALLCWPVPALAQAPVAGTPEGLSSSDWAGIRATYQAGRHAARAVENGFQVRNPAQRLRAEFDGRGIRAWPDGGEWSWGLELVSYGFEGQQSCVTRSLCSDAVGARVSYDWGAGLEEWYINDARGLEHGYTLAQRPQGGAGELSLRLDLRGDLRPEVHADGRGVSFLDADGTPRLTYAGLRVFDADGVDLPARISALPTGLRLSVHEAGARYPLTIDPIVQQAYLKASNTDAGDRFGWSLALSGTTLVIGAPKEDSDASGVNGNQQSSAAPDSGAAYVFVRTGTTWSQQAYLKASNPAQNNQFGFSLALFGNTLVVGAPGESSDATGVNGNQNNFNSPFSGAAYVFVRNGLDWSQQAYLKASNTDIGDQFGLSVDVSGNTAVVGTIYEDSVAKGVNGNQLDNSLTSAGAAYVFERIGGLWNQQAYLKASNTDAHDGFGISVAVSGETVVVGAHAEDSSAVGVGGSQTSNAVGESGAAYVFVRNGALWSQEAYIKASNTGPSDVFGWSLDIFGNTLVVGAPGEDSNATGVNGNQLDDSVIGAGALYVFVRSGTLWNQQAYIKAASTDVFDQFGWQASLSANTLLVGSPGDDSGDDGVNGDPGLNNAADAGSAYVFDRSGVTWSQTAYLKASNPDPGDSFGFSLAVDGSTALVGAVGESSSTTGVNGFGFDNGTLDAGAAYVFDLGEFVTTFCAQSKPTSVPGCSPSLKASEPSLAGGEWIATDIPRSSALASGNTLGIYIYSHGVGLGASSFNVTVPFGTLCIQGFLRSAPACAPISLFTQSGICNTGLMPLSPNCNGGALGLAVGEDVNVQLWYRDPGVAADSSFSNAIFYTLQ